MIEKFEPFNQHVFLVLNAGFDHSGWLDVFSIYVAEYLIFVPIIALIWLWLKGDPAHRAGLVGTTLATSLALGFNQIIAAIWFHPRPFSIPLGQLLIPHVPDSSFPSDHVTFIATIALGLMTFTIYRRSAIILFIVAAITGWSRVYVGVHFPFDIFGGFIVALVSTLCIRPLQTKITDPLSEKICIPLYRYMFVWPIARGWFER